MIRVVELHILLTPNKEHRKVFPNVHIVGFQNGLRITFLEPNYRNLTRVEGVNHVGKKLLGL